MIDENRKLEKASRDMRDDYRFAREVDRHTVPYWSSAWPRINALSRKGLVRVTPLTREMAEVQATEAVFERKEMPA